MAIELRARWGRHELPFTLRRSARARLAIVVQPDGRVEVAAPEHATEDEICRRVSRKGDWIVRQRNDFASWRPRTPPRQYVSGETHLLHGKQLKLKVLREEREWVKADGARLYVATPSWASRDKVKALLDDWYATEAKAYLRARFEMQSLLWARHGVEVRALIVRKLLARWGSLTQAGRMVLNAELVRASPHLVDYVIAHEMAHSVYPDHGQQWQRLFSKVMPDWRARKVQLEQQLA